jgi:hypothetical protein
MTARALVSIGAFVLAATAVAAAPSPAAAPAPAADPSKAELWFDAQSGLLVRLMRYQETPIGRNPTRIDYADYRESDGVKIPFRWTVARPGGSFTIQLDSSEQNAPLDDKVFEKPAPRPPA